MSEERLDDFLSRMQSYYSQRAPEYEAIYYRPDGERKRQLDEMIAECRRFFAGANVLEVACGTGFWTKAIEDVAASVVATDGSEEMLGLAREKDLDTAKVELRIADAYDLSDVIGDFDAGMANFWFSHVPKSRTQRFLDGLHERIGSGARVMMMDNVHIQGMGGELTKVDGIEDEWRIRELGDGTAHHVLKNYYEADELDAVFSPSAKDLRIEVWSCYWWVTYRVR